MSNNQKDISIENISVTVPGKTLIQDTNLKIGNGRKYGLIGRNGIGKSIFLKHIVERIIPIQNNIDIFYVKQELEFDKDKTIFQIVLEANRKRNKLMNKIDKLNELMENDSYENNDDILNEYNKTMEQLHSIDFMKDESIIRKILFGLGFEHQEQDMKFSQFSGGWKMRVSLARGLYMKPTLLLLDEPTNHLDLNAVIWLTDYLVNVWRKTLIIVSHDSYFLNEICTDIIHLENKKLTYYKGNYDVFRKVYEQHIREYENKWSKIQKRIKEMKNKKISKADINKFLKQNREYEPSKQYKVNIMFPQAINIKWPALILSDIGFSYNENKKLFENINLSLYENDKITIVGKNGVGKSTFLQIIMGILEPNTGEMIKDTRVRIGYYNQHVSDVLPLERTPIEFLQSVNKNLSEKDARKILGSIGLKGEIHIQQIETLSGGQKSRVALSSLIVMNPDILLLDEATNHLDIESIDSLINAINKFNGAVIMITHNIDVIQKTNSLIYNLSDMKLTQIDFDNYYKIVLDEINKE